MRILAFESLCILLDRSSSVKNSRLYFRHIFAESSVFILDLVCKLTCMTHDQDRCLTGNWLNLLKGCEDKHSSLTKSRLRLAEDIRTEYSLWNADLLDCKAIEPMLDKVPQEVTTCKRSRVRPSSQHNHHKIHCCHEVQNRSRDQSDCLKAEHRRMRAENLSPKASRSWVSLHTAAPKLVLIIFTTRLEILSDTLSRTSLNISLA
jgi:hypothetical protein